MRFNATENTIILADNDWEWFDNVRSSLNENSSKIRYVLKYAEFEDKCDEAKPSFSGYLVTTGKKTLYKKIKAIEIKGVNFPPPQKGKKLTLFVTSSTGGDWVCAYRDEHHENYQKYSEFYNAINQRSSTKTASSTNTPTSARNNQNIRLEKAKRIFAGHTYEALCREATWIYKNKLEFWDKNDWKSDFQNGVYASLLAQHLGYDCDVGSNGADTIACHRAVLPNANFTSLEWQVTNPNYFQEGQKHYAVENQKHVKEAKRRGLSCGVSGASATQIASSSTTPSNTPSSAELTAAQKEAERLRQELAALKAQQEQQQQNISSDKQKPVINIAGTAMNGPQGTIKGYVRDNTGVAEVRVDGKQVEVDNYGNFMANTYVPDGGINVSIEAVDVAGLTSSMSVRLDRLASTKAATITFDRLNPLGRKVSSNSNALALIIGVDGYKSTPARAMYADSDAKVFADYASQKLGIPTNRIKTLVNDGAGERELLLSIKSWLSRSVKQNQSDVYIFFAGHGLASDDGSKMYLLPYDGAPELLDKTAILRDELFADISAANPRSVTVFLDTCYSGTTRGTDMLIASRPIAIRALEQSIPDNFTVMTAAAGDQTAKPLEEAKHGMFSYFLMKGMEGEADANNDNEITAGELHSYVQTNVVQQSSGSQTPELQGDADRVLVRFQ
jgi:hypothetical protein